MNPQLIALTLTEYAENWITGFVSGLVLTTLTCYYVTDKIRARQNGWDQLDRDFKKLKQRESQPQRRPLSLLEKEAKFVEHYGVGNLPLGRVPTYDRRYAIYLNAQTQDPWPKSPGYDGSYDGTSRIPDIGTEGGLAVGYATMPMVGTAWYDGMRWEGDVLVTKEEEPIDWAKEGWDVVTNADAKRARDNWLRSVYEQRAKMKKRKPVRR